MQSSVEQTGTKVMRGILPLYQEKGFLILDGGFGTTLEANGVNMQNFFWGINEVKEDPEVIKKTHRQFVEAGADIFLTGSYKASP